MRSTLSYMLLVAVLFNSRASGLIGNGECKSIEIRSREQLGLLKNCSVVLGYVRIVNLHAVDEDFIGESTIEEITGYLLVYRMQGLRSLEKLFPRLVLIRGDSLLFDKYSFVIHENRDLENLGLRSLLRIERGDVRVQDNPVLCFINTINWFYLLGNSSHQQVIRRTKPPGECPVCKAIQTNDVTPNDDVNKPPLNCWSFELYQKEINPEKECPEACTTGCTDTKQCCSKKCLSGCSDKNCTRCSNYQLGLKCLDSCPITYLSLNKRKCITETECASKKWIIFGRSCIEKCPEHYEAITKNGRLICSIQCKGDYVINGRKDLGNLRDCNSIDGSLTIELKNIKDNLLEELTNSLKHIKEISGYLKVERSSQLLSLDFLSELHTIRGEKLINGRYSFYVVDNHHLEHIWRQNQKVTLLKGKIYFHLNPRLCYDKIIALAAESIRSGETITSQDVARNSNGERAICGQETVRKLNATVEAINSTAVLIKVNPMSADDKDVLIGYLYYYKEAPSRNVSIYDARHGCGHDNWHMDISLNQNVRHVITNLKKNTQYAYFLKTLTVTVAHMQIEGFSEVDYFRTLSATPSQVADVYYYSPSASAIVIHWWPPRVRNGKIGKYIIDYGRHEENCTEGAVHGTACTKVKTHGEAVSEEEGPQGECNCTFRNPFYSGPTPEDENYYNREQVIFDNALTNLVYVQKKISVKNETMPKADHKKLNQTDDNDFDMQTNETQKKIMEKIYQDIENKSLQLQDTGIEGFQIVPPVTCSLNKANQSYLIENSCESGVSGNLVPGESHTFRIGDLLPDTKYWVSIRACTAFNAVQYNCGRNLTFVAKTISKQLDEFFKNIGLSDKPGS